MYYISEFGLHLTSARCQMICCSLEGEDRYQELGQCAPEIHKITKSIRISMTWVHLGLATAQPHQMEEHMQLAVQNCEPFVELRIGL